MFANDVTNALAEVFPSDPPRFLARTPHGYHDPALVHSELKKAGFSSVVIETSTWNHKSVLQPILRDGHFAASSG